jgi:hypothetical protein
MHLFAAWTSLGTFDLLRLLGLPAAVLVAALLPGRLAARAAALAVALAAALLAELAAPWFVRAGWPLVWLLVAWVAGAADPASAAARAPRRSTFEAGLLALTLGLALVLLLLVAASRQSLEPPGTRLTSLGALLVGFGLLHLMLRRHLRRALVAFAALGLGLELLAAAARSTDALHAGAPAGVALAATLVALALVHRVAGSRERHAGSPYVADAHELHD